jgi:hypothetical protein
MIHSRHRSCQASRSEDGIQFSDRSFDRVVKVVKQTVRFEFIHSRSGMNPRSFRPSVARNGHTKQGALGSARTAHQTPHPHCRCLSSLIWSRCAFISHTITMAPANSNETYCTFTLASDVTAGGLPSEQDIAKDLESTDNNVRSVF